MEVGTYWNDLEEVTDLNDAFVGTDFTQYSINRGYMARSIDM